MRASYRICAALRRFAGHQTGKARSARHDIHRHALTLHNSAVYPRNTARYAAVINYLACLKIIACVNDDIGSAEQGRGIVLREPFARRCDRNIAVYFSEMLAGCIGLAAPDIALIKKRLTLKIAQLYDVVVDDEYMPDSARYDEAAVPSAPCPTMATCARPSFSCPAWSIYGRRICLSYLLF